MSRKKIRKISGWFSPYTVINNKKICNLKYTGSGVYIIKENDIIVYIGRSKSDIKKTLYRHFQVWTDLRYNKIKNYIARITYWNNDVNNYSVKVITCSPEEACTLEELLIKRIEPRDNKLKAEKYGFKYKTIIKKKFEDVPF